MLVEYTCNELLDARMCTQGEGSRSEQQGNDASDNSCGGGLICAISNSHLTDFDWRVKVHQD